MTITIDIPAISELAAAIRYHADNMPDAGRREALIKSMVEGATISPEDRAQFQALAEAPTAADPQPAKRTRRTKAEMDAERKAIEETKGRRVDAPITTLAQDQVDLTGEQAAAVDAVLQSAPFQWTLELLKDTFLAITPEDDSQEAKDAANAKLLALRQIREAIAPEAQNLSTMDEKHYAEFACQATAWYREQGLELKLPEGCEL